MYINWFLYLMMWTWDLKCQPVCETWVEIHSSFFHYFLEESLLPVLSQHSLSLCLSLSLHYLLFMLLFKDIVDIILHCIAEPSSVSSVWEHRLPYKYYHFLEMGKRDSPKVQNWMHHSDTYCRCYIPLLYFTSCSLTALCNN